MKLLEPIKVKDIEVRNRVVMPAADTHFGNMNGTVSDKTLNYYSLRAKGGVGLIIVEGTAIHKLAKATMKMMLIDNDDKIEGLTKLAKAIKDNGSVAMIQFMHAGSQTSQLFTGDRPVSPSGVKNNFLPSENPRALEKDEIKEIITYYGDAAERARKANFDGVEIHAAHGYLISQFLSPRHNNRTDEYGGNLENRMRFLVEIYDEIKKRVGNDMIIGMRINGSDYVEGGFDINESKIVCQKMEDLGIDIINVSAATDETPDHLMIPYMTSPRGIHTNLSAQIKKVIKSVPIIGVGRINDPDVAEQILQDNKADMVALARQSICDPFFVNKIKEGKKKDIMKCMACNTCINNLALQKEIVCAFNPDILHSEFEIEKTKEPKKILIVGAGPGGLTAAKYGKLKGHDVILIEKDNKIGGTLHLANSAPYKKEINNIMEYYEHKLKDLEIDLRLNTELSPDLVDKIEPDVVILATGSKPIIPDIQGLNEVNYKVFNEILEKESDVGENVVVLGGGMVGIELSEYLVSKNKKISLIEKMKKLGANIDQMVKFVVMYYFNKEKNIQKYLKAKVTQITKDKIIMEYKGESTEIPFDDLIISTGVQSNLPELKEIKSKVPIVKKIGDCKRPKKIVDAVSDAYKIIKKL
ncbi:MAG: FAD-binding protein [Promethearchaeota archaeon]|nr:MAG: FAD-binding protein [Candidatus Lokiarchaeota archaeon]